MNAGLTDDVALSTFQGRSSSASSFYASFRKAPMAWRPWLCPSSSVSSSKSSKTQVTPVFDYGISRTTHSQKSSKEDDKHCHVLIWSLNLVACVVWLSPLYAIQRWAHVNGSKLKTEYARFWARQVQTLQGCTARTDWDSIKTHLPVSTKCSDTVTDIIHTCTDLCIPTRQTKSVQWM